MSLFDTLKCNLTCPRCGTFVDIDVEVFSPFANQFIYNLGDMMKNVTKKNKTPDCGKYEGYSECPLCGKDFFLDVYVKNGKITSVEINKNKEGYIE